MRRYSLMIVCSALLATVSCDKQPAPPPSPAEIPAEQPTDTSQVVPASAPDAAATVPEGFVVSTNEPFWQASVEGNSVSLKGPEQERQLSIDSSEALADGRRVTAHDEKGKLEIHVIDLACQDDMSGADFPFTATLAFDGAAPAKGCARRSTDPVPQPQ